MRKGLKFSADDPRVIACKEAVSKLGGFTKTARIFGITPQSVYKWEVVPKYWCLEVARLTGIDIHTLRPDVYGVKKHRNGQRARGNNDAYADPTTTAATEMDGRATPGSQRDAGERGNGFRHSAGYEPQPQPGFRADLPRPGAGIAGISKTAKGQPPAPFPRTAEENPTITGQCGYGGRSW